MEELTLVNGQRKWVGGGGSLAPGPQKFTYCIHDSILCSGEDVSYQYIFSQCFVSKAKYVLPLEVTYSKQ